MAEIKFTKSELRQQQNKLAALQKYLPTLQLKKALLQVEVNQARQEIVELERIFEHEHDKIGHYAALLTDETSLDYTKAVKIKEIHKRHENIAGVDIPYFEGVTFEEFTYDLLDTSAWVDATLVALKALTVAHVKVAIAREKKRALEHELREVSIRVNLFEKILIPRATGNIKKIRVFLGDLQLAAVSQAKSAKNKIEERKRAAAEARVLQAVG